MKETIKFLSEGLVLVGDLYRPDHFDACQKYPAVVIGGSHATGKEAMSGGYAFAFAEEGFIALAIEARCGGRSEAGLRGWDNPMASIADYRNAVSFLRSARGVDENNIYLVGISGSAGYMAAVAADDRRVRGIAMVASWLDDRGMVNRFNPMPLAQRLAVPTLMIHSDEAVLPCHVRRFFGEVATDNKSLYWIEGCRGDFYDEPWRVLESVRVAAAFFERQNNRRTIERFFEVLESGELELLKDFFDGSGKRRSKIAGLFGPMRFSREIYGTEDKSLFIVKFQEAPEYAGRLDDANSAGGSEGADAEGVDEVEEGGESGSGPGGRDYVGIFKVRDGKIAEYTEYCNSSVMVRALGFGYN